MALNKLDLKSDGVADLYRAALYLGRGSRDMGFDFLEKAEKKLGQSFIDNSIKPNNHQQELYLAEKILDQYLKLKHQ